MSSDKKKVIFDKIKNLVFATEENTENDIEDEYEENNTNVQEIFSVTENTQEINDIRKAIIEKEAKEKEEVNKRIKEELKAEIKEELKAEITEKEKEIEIIEESAEETSIESILETVIKEAKEEKKRKEQKKSNKKFFKNKVEKQEKQNIEKQIEKEDIKEPQENKDAKVEKEETIKETDIEKENLEQLDATKNKEAKDDKKQKTGKSIDINVSNEQVTKNIDEKNQNISYTISLSKKDIEKALKKAEKRQKKLEKQQLSENKKLAKQRKLEETLSNNAIKVNKNSEPITNRIKYNFRIFLNFINDKSDEYVTEDDIIELQAEPIENIEIKNNEDINVKQEKTENKKTNNKKNNVENLENKAQKVPIVNLPIAKDIKKDPTKLIDSDKEKSKEKNLNKENTNSNNENLSKVRSRILFEKPSAKKLSDEDKNKLLINGHKVPEYVYETDVYKITLASDKISNTIKKEYEDYIKEQVQNEKLLKKTDELSFDNLKSIQKYYAGMLKHRMNK